MTPSDIETRTVRPSFQAVEDAVFVLHSDGWLRKYNTIGEIEPSFEPVNTAASPE